MKRLFLNSNTGIGTDGAIALALVCRSHRSMKRLGLSNCNIYPIGGLELLTTLNNNTNIERICVYGNQFEENIDVLSAMKRNNRFNFDTIQ